MRSCTKFVSTSHMYRVMLARRGWAWRPRTNHEQLKAVRLLRGADVVVYDDLGTEAVLNSHVPLSVERIYVGKRGGRPSIKQVEINKLLVELCTNQGKNVVRLKGGCVSTFGRAGQELRAVVGAKVPVHMVPGVSSALAAPLLAGFPLTDTELSDSYAVLDGHDPNSVEWKGFTAVKTLVILMGAKNLASIASHLIAAGRCANTPGVVVERASSPEQEVHFGTLGSLAAGALALPQLGPCVTIVGAVAGLPASFLPQERQ
eukprot:jgi/Botrbrau1/5225/Bobra.0172s0089.2